MSKSKPVLFIGCNECGGTGFISQLNQYDVYELIDGELRFQRSESINEKMELFCRDCGTELEDKKAYKLIRS